MPRERGWLKPDALKAGVPDQWATILGPARHVVEIVWQDGQYVVRHSAILATAETCTLSYEKGDDLTAARHAFRQEVRALGGRA